MKDLIPVFCLFSFLMFTAFLHSCSSLDQLSKFSKPELSISDAQISELSLQEAEITFDVTVKNPNPVAINLSDYTYDFLLNERSFVQGNATEGVEIKAADSSTVKIPVKIGYRELFDTFNNLRQKDEVDYNFQFTAGTNVPVLGRTELPLQKKGTLPLIKLPSFNLDNIELRSMSLTKVDINVDLSVSNPNNFSLNLSGLEYNLDLNGTSPLSGAINRSVSVGRKSASQISVPISLSVLELGSSIRDIFSGEEVQYSLSGSTSIGSSLPFFNTSTFNFDKNGVVDILN